jgi:hypothetical protein
MRTLVIATIVLTGCGPGSVALDDYAIATRGAYCSHLETCGVIESVETCLATNTGFDFTINGLDLRLTASLRAAIEAGKVRYDGDSAKRCLDALGATRGCDPTAEISRVRPDECLQIFNGRLGADEECARDDECISRQCDVPGCEEACCTGACVGDTPPVRAQLGESCEVAECDNGLFCDDGTATCVALKSQGGFCVSIAECRFGLYCNQSGECVGNLPTLGQACSGPCRDEGTQCSTTSRVCVEVGLLGAPCQMSSDCSPFYVCDAGNHCSAGAPIGAPCSVSARCADVGAFCDIPGGEGSGTCAPLKAEGEVCDAGTACQSGTCDTTTRQCIAEPVCI